MAINFPDSPANGDSFTSNNKTWVFDGTVWNITSGTNSVADGAITAAKLAANAVTQAKLAANVSGITITTTANRDTDITSPFTGQFCFLTDTSVLQRYTGSAWVVAIASAPAAPTALSGTALGTTSVSIAFTPGADYGATITNYQYALSTNSGSTYGSFLAVDPADATSPITISSLTAGTTYTIKLKAVNMMGAGTESAGVSVTTSEILSSMEILMVAGGGGGGNRSNGGRGSPGGAGGLIHITSYPVQVATNYSVSIAGTAALDTQGSNTTYSGNSRTLTALGGGYGRNNDSQGAAPAGGSSGGSWYPGYASNAPTQSSTTNDGVASYASTGFGNAGGTSGASTPYGSGGGGAGGAGANFNAAGGPVGGIGRQISITGTATYYAGGGGAADWAGGSTTRYAGGLGGGGRGDNTGDAADRHGTANTGGGGGANGQGGSGVVILRYPSAYTITIGAGLTGSTATDGLSKVTTITAGSGNVSWA